MFSFKTAKAIWNESNHMVLEDANGNWAFVVACPQPEKPRTAINEAHLHRFQSHECPGQKCLIIKKGRHASVFPATAEPVLRRDDYGLHEFWSGTPYVERKWVDLRVALPGVFKKSDQVSVMVNTVQASLRGTGKRLIISEDGVCWEN